MNNAYSYLRFVAYKGIPNWSVGYIVGHSMGFTEKYPLVSIGTFLHRNKTAITIHDNLKYKRVTIRTFGGGIGIRDIELGANIGTKKQFIINEGQFLVSKIDARNGAFGVAGKDVDGAIITGNFWTYDVDKHIINPFFLAYLTSTKIFASFSEKASVGTTNRRYLQENLFLQQQIPLPSLSEQQALVDAYNQRLKQAQELEQKAMIGENEMERKIRAKLNYSVSFGSSYNGGLHLIDYKNVSRWDTSFFFSQKQMQSSVPLKNIGDCICHFLEDNDGKSLRRETKKTPMKKYTYIGMENVEKNSGHLCNPQIVHGNMIKSQTVAIPYGYMIYGKLRPYLNKYWLNLSDNDNLICSSEFFVFNIKDEINKLYFEYILGSSIIQEQLVNITSGARMPRISEMDFTNLSIPLPPLSVQQQIVDEIQKRREEISNCRTRAAQLRAEATLQFESAIFNE